MEELLKISGHVEIVATEDGEVYFADEGPNYFTFWGKLIIAKNIIEAAAGTGEAWGTDISHIYMGTDNTPGNSMTLVLYGPITAGPSDPIGWAQDLAVVPTAVPLITTPAAYLISADPNEVAVQTIWNTTITNTDVAVQTIAEIGLGVDLATAKAGLAARRVVPIFEVNPGGAVEITWTLRIG